MPEIDKIALPAAERARLERVENDPFSRSRRKDCVHGGVRPTVPAPEAPNGTAGAPQGRNAVAAFLSSPAARAAIMAAVVRVPLTDTAGATYGVTSQRCSPVLAAAIIERLKAAADVPAPEAPNSTAGAPQACRKPADHQPSPLDGAPRLNAVERTLIESCHAALRFNLTLTRDRCLNLLTIIDKLAPVWRAPPPPPAKGCPAPAATDSNS